MSLSRRVGVNTLWQILGRLVTSTLAFLITAVLLPRVLDAPQLGIFLFHLNLYLMLANVLDFGAGTIVIREAARDRGRAGRLLGMLVGIKARFALAGVLLLIGVALAFEGLSLRAGLMCLAALHLFAHAPSGAAAVFAVDMVFSRSARLAVAGQATWLAGTVALALFGSDEPALYLLAFGAGLVVHGALAWSWARQRVAVTFDAPRSERAALWRESWPAGVSMAAASLYFYIDGALIRPLLGVEAVARYGNAYRLMTFVLMLPVLFSQVILPVYSRLWARGPAELRPFFVRTTRFLLAVGACITATVWLVAPDVMLLIFPPEYVTGARSLQILSLAVVLVFCAYPHVMLLLAAGEQRLMMRISVAGAALNVLANLWAIPRFGIEGAAAVTVATEAFVLTAAALASARRTGLHYPLAGLARPLLCAGAAAGALALALPHVPGTPVARVGAGLLAGLLGVLLCGVLPPDFGTEQGAPVDIAPGPLA